MEFDYSYLWISIEYMQILNLLRFLGSPITYELREFFISWEFSNGELFPNFIGDLVEKDEFKGNLE